MTTVVEDITIPDTASGLEEMLGNRDTVNKLFAAGKFPEAIRAYATVTNQQNQDIRAQVTAEVEKVTAQFLKDHAAEGFGTRALDLRPDGNPVAGLNPGRNADARYNAKYGLFSPRAVGAKLDKEFTGQMAASDFFTTIWHNAPRDAETNLRLNRIRNAFSSEIPSEGGFLIPETLRSELLRLSLETSIVRPRARTIPMESLRVPFPAIDETSHASSVYGGIVAYWTEEGAALTASSATFGRIVLEAKKLTTYTEVPNELLADSIGSFEAFINQIFPEAMGFYEDIAFIKGSGVGEPLGVLDANNTAMVVVNKESAQDPLSIVWENIVKMYSRMLPQSLGRAVWIATIDAMPQLATMALAVGTGGGPIWLTNGQDGFPMQILGRPVIFTEKAPATVGSQGDLSFVDLSMYLIGDRQAMSAMSSPHYKFANDVTAFRITQRLDGRPWVQSAITPQNGGPTLSPYVQLQSRP
jgi:HK97 family phage major capsid protein